MVAAQRVGFSTELPGRTTAPLVAEIRPQVSGLIEARKFTEGTRVKAGQVLYQIDAASYRAAYASAQAALAKAEATAEADRLTAERQAALARIEAVSQQDAQDAAAALKQAQSDVAAAQAALQTARINLARTTITSPIDGWIDVSAVTRGALVTAEQTTALTTVRQFDPIQVDITQSSADLLKLKRDIAAGRVQQVSADEAQVKLLLEDGSTYAQAGRLRFSGVSVNTGTGAVTLRAVFANPDGLLLPGMYVRAVLDTAVADDALTVAQQAVTRDAQGGTSVLVVDAAGVVQRRTITVDRAVGNRWRVSQGLSVGERVVIEGQQKVKPGDRVQAQTVAAVGTTGPQTVPAAGSPGPQASAAAPTVASR